MRNEGGRRIGDQDQTKKTWTGDRASIGRRLRNKTTKPACSSVRTKEKQTTEDQPRNWHKERDRLPTQLNTKLTHILCTGRISRTVDRLAGGEERARDTTKQRKQQGGFADDKDAMYSYGDVAETALGEIFLCLYSARSNEWQHPRYAPR